MPAQDLYAILGVKKDASEEEVKEGPIAGSPGNYHPDVNKEKARRRKFKEISAAFEVSATSRSGSSTTSSAPKVFAPALTPRPPTPVPTLRRLPRRRRWKGAPQGRSGGSPFGGGGFDFSDLMNDLFKQSRSHPQRAAGADIAAEITIDLKDAALGAERDLSIDRPSPCGTCHGDGTAPGSHPRECPQCHGQGRISMPGAPFDLPMPCPRCGGRAARRPALPHLSRLH